MRSFRCAPRLEAVCHHFGALLSLSLSQLLTQREKETSESLTHAMLQTEPETSCPSVQCFIHCASSQASVSLKNNVSLSSEGLEICPQPDLCGRALSQAMFLMTQHHPSTAL